MKYQQNYRKNRRVLSMLIWKIIVMRILLEWSLNSKRSKEKVIHWEGEIILEKNINNLNKTIKIFFSPVPNVVFAEPATAPHAIPNSSSGNSNAENEQL